MGKAFLKKTTSLLQAKRKRKRWQRTMISLSLVVAMVTSCLLIHPAITMERTAICGQEEHTHTEECYEHRLVCGKTEQSAVPATEEKVLNCPKAVHEHGEGCYDAEGQLVCTAEAHNHDDSCYQIIRTEGVEGHTHTDACYEDALICGKQEHTHTEACYPKETEAATQAQTKTVTEAAKTETATEKAETEKATEAEKPEARTLTVKNGEYTIQVDCPADAKIPKNAVLSIREIKKNDSDYNSTYERAASVVLMKTAKKIETVRFFDLSISADGKEIQPKATVNVKITFTKPIQSPEGSEVRVVRLGDDADVLATNTNKANGSWNQIIFKAKKLTVYATAEIAVPVAETAVTGAETSEVMMLAAETEETETEAATEVVTEALTEESTEAATEESTEEATEAVTEESTEAVTEEMTEESTEEPDTEEMTEEDPATPHILTAKGSDYTVEVTYTTEAGIPEGAELQVREIAQGTAEYESYYQQAMAAVQEGDTTSISFARFFDISFVYEGEEIEPSAPVAVKITYADAVEVPEAGEVKSVHFGDEAEVLNVQTNEKNGAMDEVTFDTESFSVYGIVGTETLTGDVLTADGKTYTVTVTYGADAKIPEGASLKITEFDESSQEYAEIKALVTEKKKVENKFFDVSSMGLDALDISIVDKDGKEMEPAAPVGVKIERKSLPENVDEQDLQNTMEVEHIDESSGKAVAYKVADTNNQTSGTVSIEKSGAVAEFQVGSFSSFVITWGNDKSATVYFVNNNGIEITTNATLNAVAASGENATVLDLSKYAVDGYTFQNVQLVHKGSNYPNGKTIGNKLKPVADADGNVKWQYTDTTMAVGETQETTHTAEVEKEDKIYAIYSEGNSLTTVSTVDNKALGFHLYMTDYSTAGMSINIGGPYGDGSTKGSTKQGLYASTIEGDILKTVDGTSLESLFSKSNEVSHLFLKSVYDETGYFYYNSADNFASLSGSNFTVYNQLGTPSGGNEFYYKRGNFMPYNTLNTSSILNRNLYDDNGTALTNTNPRYNEALYGFNESNNFYFGMYGTADFYQPVDGQVNGSDMIYEFTGDDDMVVYIDGTLVLDLGGIHDAQSGFINFATGCVGYTNQTTNNPVKWNYTTIKSMFEKAKTLNTTRWDGDTFADGTEHKIQIFYQERGAGASNLKMKVNIPPIPDGSITVSKTVEGLDSTQAAEEIYILQLKKKAAGTDTYVGAANQKYTLSDETSITHTTDEDGKFTIKAGQIATFAGIEAGTEIQVVEPDTGRIYDVTYTSTDSSGNLIDSVGSGSAVVPAAGYVAVKVKNNAEKHSKSLTIRKKFFVEGNEIADAPSTEKYNGATYTLKESSDNGKTWSELYTISYSSFTNASYTFSQLDPRKQYQVIENITKDTDGATTGTYYEKTEYEVLVGSNGNGTVASGVKLEDSNNNFINNTVTFKNHYQKDYVSFMKHNESNAPLPGAVFTLYQADGKNVVTDNLVSGENGDFTPGQNYKLSEGTYYLVETSAPAGYNKLAHRVKIVVNAIGTISATMEGSSVGKELAVLNESTHTYVITIQNNPGIELPNTGGSGTLPYTLSGLALMFIAAWMYGFIMRSRGRRLN